MIANTNVLMCKQFQREALSGVQRICLVILDLVDWWKTTYTAYFRNDCILFLLKLNVKNLPVYNTVEEQLIHTSKKQKSFY